MADLFPTKTRLALLRDVAREAVRREYSTDFAYDFNTRSDRTVTAVIAEQKRAGWVELDTTLFETGGKQSFQVRYWRLTDVGRSVLDANGVDW